MKNLLLALVATAFASLGAWAQNDGSNGASGRMPDYYYSADSYEAQPPGSDQRFDPIAHYWDYYRLDPGDGRDVDQTTPP